MDLALRTTSRYASDRSWLAHGNGIRTHDATLDLSAFTEADHYPNGYLVDGIVVAKLASGLYAPASGLDNETQTITINATGGTFTITVGGQTTASIAYNATAAAVQTALEELLDIAPGDIVVTGGPGATNPYTLTFGGQYAGQNVPAVTTAAGSLTGGAGTAAVSTSNAGSGDGGTIKGILFNPCDVAGGVDVIGPVMHAGDIVSTSLPSIGSMVDGGWSVAAKIALPAIVDLA